jgi:hypothetical protein
MDDEDRDHRNLISLHHEEHTVRELANKRTAESSAMTGN